MLHKDLAHLKLPVLILFTFYNCITIFVKLTFSVYITMTMYMLFTIEPGSMLWLFLLYIVFLFCFSLKWRDASFFICYLPMIILLKCSTWLIASKYNFPHRPNISSLSVAVLFWKICLLEPPSELAAPGAYHIVIILGLPMTAFFFFFSPMGLMT